MASDTRRLSKFGGHAGLSSKDPRSALGHVSDDVACSFLGAAEKSLQNLTVFPHSRHDPFAAIASDDSMTQ